MVLLYENLHIDSYYREKITGLVDFPTEGLDMSEHMCGPNTSGKKFIYDLFAVSNHHGGYGGGHCEIAAIAARLADLIRYRTCDPR